MMTETELKAKVAKIMKSLKCSYEEAIQIIADDKEVDKMTSIKEVESDLTAEQKAVAKKSRQTGTKAKTESKPREKKADLAKAKLIKEVAKVLTELNAEVEITNAEREINFQYGDRKFKILLTATREKK